VHFKILVKAWTAGADEYVRSLNAAKKDKKEAMKTLAEYGLTKEKIGVQREQVDATRASTSESAAMRREQAAEALQQKYFAAYKDAYKNVPEFLNDGKTLNPAL
jgi:predicted trehalose synthase